MLILESEYREMKEEIKRLQDALKRVRDWYGYCVCDRCPGREARAALEALK
jgi:hypothetical protein